MLFSAKETADYLGVKPSTLAILRSRGTGMPYTKKGVGIFYDKADIDIYQAIKQHAHRHGNAARTVYVIRAVKDGELHSIHHRRAVSLEHAVEVLALYPSLAGCEFETAEPVTVQPNQAERFRKEMEKAKPALRDAIKRTIDGTSAAARQAGSNQFDKIINKAMQKAFK